MYVVGEEGPELFTPTSAGRITPAGQTAAMLAGGSTETVQHFTANMTVTGAGVAKDAVTELRKLALQVA